MAAKRVLRNRLVGLTAALLAMTLAHTAAPETEGGEDGFSEWDSVEEMVVFGSPSASLLEGTTSTIGFGSADLQGMGVEDVSDLAEFVPNVEIRTAGSANASFFIRGVGLQDFGANATSSVTILLDGVPLNSPALQLTGLYDVEQLGVRKGPQGTGPFRNSSAGAIDIMSQKPTGSRSATARLSVGQVASPEAFDASTYRLNAAFEVPIVDDILSARVALKYDRMDPYLENGCGGLPAISTRAVDEVFCGEFIRNGMRSNVPAGLERRVGERDEFSMRGQLRLQPRGTETDWTLMLQGSRLRRDAGLGQAIGTGDTGDQLGQADALAYRDRDIRAEEEALLARGLSSSEARQRLSRNLVRRPLDTGPYRGDYNRVGQTRLDTFLALLSGSIQLDDVLIESKTSYARYDQQDDRDQDLTPNRQFEAIIEDDAWQFYQEVSMSGSVEQAPLSWDVGGYFLTEELNLTQQQLLVTDFSETLREFEQKDWSFGVWAEISFEIHDDLTLDAGARYNWERKSFDILQTRPLVPLFRQEGSYRETWDSPTWEVTLVYEITETTSSYLKWSRGWKAGHFNSNNAQGRFASPERIDAFEWGVDLSFFEDRLTVLGALFYYNYKNYQVFQIEDRIGSFPTLEIRNANDATVLGAEVDLHVTPLIGFVPEEIEQLSIRVRGGWLDTQFLDFTDTELRISGATLFPVVADFSGNALPSSPKFQVSGTLDWTIDLGRFGTIAPRYDFSWTDDVAFDPANGRGSIDFTGATRHGKYAIGQRSYALHHLRLTYQVPSDDVIEIEVAGWCQNLTDERYKTYAADLSSFQKTTLHFVGEPRTCGGEIALTW